MTIFQSATKRFFDVIAAIAGLALLWPVILLIWFLAARDTGASGFFRQIRVGRDGRLFRLVKIRTMYAVDGTTITTSYDQRITPFGAKLRRWKLDELPQLWNVLVGDMSMVGPRPDVPGYLDRLTGEDRAILALRPGITGPATLKYRNEEEILARTSDPVLFNMTVIWPDKVRINLEYLRDWSLSGDLRYIWKTLFR